MRAALFNSACSQARAFLQSRLTVRTDTPSAIADFLFRHAAEIDHLYHARLAGVHPRKMSERFIENEQLFDTRILRRHEIAQFHFLSSVRPFAGAARWRA